MSAPPDATTLAERVRAGETTARSSVEACLERIARLDPEIVAFHDVHAERALEYADAVDARLARNEDPGPLAGVPLALKSNMCLAGVETNCGSKMLRGYRPPYTATFVSRALAAGAIPVGMAHMDEFAMGSSGENSAVGVARNPWDTRRTPGGSSSGCAAAVAAGMVPLALGSDTGGSVRQPASFCGVTGFKPTYGRVSRHGLVAFGSSLDQVSPLARTVRDVELLFGVIAGRDERDATTLEEDAPEPRAGGGGLAGVRVGIPAEWVHDGLDPEVRRRVDEATLVLEQLGAELRPVSLPHTDLALPTYYVVATAEASSNLARYDGIRYGLRAPGDGTLPGMIAATRQAGFGDEVVRRILLGTYVLSSGYHDAWYGQALKVRGLLADEFRAVFEEVDLLVGPTSPTPAFLLGEHEGDPLAMYQADILTVPASLAGLPAISLPCGMTATDVSPSLPVGLQLVGPASADADVLFAARCYQDATEHHVRLPEAVR